MKRFWSISLLGIWMIIVIFPSVFNVYVKTIRHNDIQEAIKQVHSTTRISVVLNKVYFINNYNSEDREININDRMYDVVEVKQYSENYLLILEEDAVESALNSFLKNSSESNSHSNSKIPFFEAKFCELMEFKIGHMTSDNIDFPILIEESSNGPGKSEFHPPELMVS